MATKSPAVASLGGHSDSVCCCEVLAPRKLLISGGEDGLICLADLASQTSVGAVRLSAGEAVTALCPSPLDEHTVYAAAGQTVLALDLRKGLNSLALLGSAAVNAEEVNALAATAASGGWLAAGDDAGEVAVLSLPSFSEALASSSGGGGSSGGGSGRPPKPQYKTLRRGHSNICSAVAFRPHRPGELLSGGLDSRLLRWDYARLRPLQTWDLGGEAAASGGQVFNPPMVHALAVPQTEDPGLCRLVAAARGDGCVAIYDADVRPTAPAASGSRRGGGSKERQRSGRGAAAEAAPGRLCLLGRELGGHIAAVNCVSFFHGSGYHQVLTGGNDARLLLWNWRRGADMEVAVAAAAQAEAAAASVEGSSAAAGAAVVAAAEQTAAAEEEEGYNKSQVLAAEVRHGRKINWACSFEPVGGANVAVADTSCRLSLLSLR